MPEQAPSTPADGKQGYVSPMVAAAAAGAVAAAAANHHQHDVAKAEPEVLASPVDPAPIAEPVAVAPSEVEPVAPPVSESDTDRPPLEVHSLEPDLALDHIDETQPETAPKPEPVH